MNVFFEKIAELKKNCKEVYIYGAGLYGQNIYKILKKGGISVDGFVVSDNCGSRTLFDLPIFQIGEVISDDVGLILGLNRHNTAAVLQLLKKYNFDMKRVAYGNDYIDRGEIRGGYDEIPTIEITSRIGCRINCKYCPQGVLLEKYYQKDKNRESVMTIETFEKCINHIPDEATVLFSGMVEPLHNSQCVDMIKIALEKGHKVDLYSTFSEISLDETKKISKLPLGFVGLHVADKRKFANIITDDEYYKKIEYLINAKKEDGTSFVSACNAQTEPDERVAAICEGKYEIFTTMLDRAGNLQYEDLYSKQTLHGKISCSLCGQKLNHNILFPDGTLLLCCMDYGMKHVLGNLRTQSYEEIMNGEELNRVKRGISGDETEDILCRNCSCANFVMNDSI